MSTTSTAVKQALEAITNDGGKQMTTVERKMNRVARRKLLNSLPADLRDRVQRRVMTIEQARAWVCLREAFHGDVENLNSTLLTAYGVAC